MTHALGRIGQRVGPVDHRGELPASTSAVTASRSSPAPPGREQAQLLRTNRLTTAARRMRADGAETWPGDPPPLSTSVPCRGERPAQPRERPVSDVVQDHVVLRSPVGEVLRGVVDDVGGADRSHQLDVAGAAHAGDLGAERGRDLDGERADASGGAVHQHPLPGLHAPRPGSRAGRSPPPSVCAAACSKVRPAGLGTTRSASALAYSAKAPADEAEHLVAGPQSAHVGADRLDLAGRVDSRPSGSSAWSGRCRPSAGRRAGRRAACASRRG